jgi:hypothetical protein
MIFDLYHPLGICLGGVDDGHETSTWKVKTEVTEEGNNLTPIANVEAFIATALAHATNPL